MTGQELIDIMDQANRRVHIVGSPENGIIAALDLEGRLFAVLNGRVLNRVVQAAILNRSDKTTFLNPGGDALWPAPEGSCLGYEYGSGEWRVPPAITGAVWKVAEQPENKTVIRAEIDMVNNRQLGIPCEFERHIKIRHTASALMQNVTEVIRYIGARPLAKDEFLLAPWSLCQFESGRGKKVILPPPADNEIWDMYGSSHSKRRLSKDIYVVDTNTEERFQLGLGAGVPWIEFVSGNEFRVRRYAGVLPEGQYPIDISDISPGQLPSGRGVNLSVYCDPSGFMEMEACGGCSGILEPGTELSVNIITEYSMNAG
ncbi:MAG: hypothetical protein A2W90_21980 [Bacteroidetes bacterium GWF2_42_66]|nr:MAG: hypothetical protein A2W92_04795 [Bacteroidetes bacterium GWA2_42_15]OFY03243.1 MAG: hypothetical protein A2W89_18880 [Bacteroidetes bacterium GWE2_42_39]OFY45707.1 MAG: hypothetical protein A2W90_21980 [Bacteroidetes bacterium GWF2_42_66]HBL77301.1 hypothetical protein [Prolixibacteraceae bacterium]HCU62459.1 hypothetical protein [Prolixibacteraceae bacterium]